MLFVVRVQPHQLDDLPNPFPGDISPDARQQLQVFHPVHTADKPGVLDNHADLLGRRRFYLAAIHIDIPFGQFHKPADALKQHGFPRAIAPDHPVDLSLFERYIHVVQRHGIRKTLYGVFYFDHLVRHGYSPPFCMVISFLHTVITDPTANTTMAISSTHSPSISVGRGRPDK